MPLAKPSVDDLKVRALRAASDARDSVHRVLSAAPADMPVAPIHLGDLDRARVLAQGTRRQRARAAALVRRVRMIYADQQMRAEVKAGMADRGRLEQLRGAEVVQIGDAWAVTPRPEGGRTGIASLLKARRISAFEARIGVTYRSLWEKHGPLMRSCLEVGDGGGKSTGGVAAGLAYFSDVRVYLAEVEAALTAYDEEGEIIHLMHFVARDGHCLRQVTNGSRSFNDAVKGLREGLGIAGKVIDRWA